MNKLLDDHLLEKKSEKSYKAVKWIYAFLILLVFGSGISTALSWYDIFTILYLGPTLFIIGLIITIFSLSIRNKILFFLGLVPLVISIFWPSIIYLFSLSPSECKIIIPLSLSIATVFIFIVGTILFIKIYTRDIT